MFYDSSLLFAWCEIECISFGSRSLIIASLLISTPFFHLTFTLTWFSALSFCAGVNSFTILSPERYTSWHLAGNLNLHFRYGKQGVIISVDKFSLLCSVPVLTGSYLSVFHLWRAEGRLGRHCFHQQGLFPHGIYLLRSYTFSFLHLPLFVSLCLWSCTWCSTVSSGFLVYYGSWCWKISHSLGYSHSLLPSGYYIIRPFNFLSLFPFAPYPTYMIYGDDGFLFLRDFDTQACLKNLWSLFIGSEFGRMGRF